MGQYAFDGMPAHAEGYAPLISQRAARFFGISEGWNMPGGRIVAPFGAAQHYPGVEHYVLTLHISGPNVRRLDGRFDNIGRRGTIALQMPGSGGIFGARAASAVDYAHLYFREGLVAEVCDGRVIASRDLFGVSGLPVIGDIQAYVRRMQDHGDPPPSIEMDGRAFGIAHRLMMASASKTPATGGLSRSKLAIIDDLVRHAPSADLRLSTLAQAAGLSTFHFARQFKTATGATPAAYLMRARLELAKELLENGMMSLGEIAVHTGFASQSHFTNRFRAAYGTTPHSHRREHRRLIVA